MHVSQCHSLKLFLRSCQMFWKRHRLCITHRSALHRLVLHRCCPCPISVGPNVSNPARCFCYWVSAQSGMPTYKRYRIRNSSGRFWGLGRSPSVVHIWVTPHTFNVDALRRKSSCHCHRDAWLYPLLALLPLRRVVLFSNIYRTGCRCQSTICSSWNSGRHIYSHSWRWSRSPVKVISIDALYLCFIVDLRLQSLAVLVVVS